MWQTSWGVSWRLIGAMIMTHGDDNGLVLPPKVAPIQVVIIPIYYSDEDAQKVLKKANEISSSVSSNNIRVHVDDRDQLTPGYKFHDWELKGIPLRIEIGPKDIEKNKVVLVKRINKEKIDVPIDDVAGKVNSILDDIQKQMLISAKKILDESTHNISSYEEFKSQIEKGGFLSTPWCGKQECEEKIKEETGADIRVIPFESEDSTKKCVYCNEQSVSVPIFARGY